MIDSLKTFDGTILHNQVKKDNGSIVVTDRDGYKKYLAERDLRLRVYELEKKTDDILSLLTSINSKIK